MATPIRIFTDGACSPNPGSMGVGVVVEWQKNTPTIISKYGGEGTNNIAEYMALIEAQDFIKENVVKDVIINSDSTLMVKQVNKEWKCKDVTLKVLCTKAQNRMQWFKENGYNIELVYIPREFNLADTPAKNGVKKK